MESWSVFRVMNLSGTSISLCAFWWFLVTFRVVLRRRGDFSKKSSKGESFKTLLTLVCFLEF